MYLFCEQHLCDTCVLCRCQDFIQHPEVLKCKLTANLIQDSISLYCTHVHCQKLIQMFMYLIFSLISRFVPVLTEV